LRSFKRLVLISLLIVGLHGSLSPGQINSLSDFQIQRMELRSHLEKIGIAGEPSVELTAKLRDHIHRNIRLESSTEYIDYYNFASTFKIATIQKDVGLLCGGLSLLFMAALESLGIPSRFVGILSSTEVPYDSHATVEIYIDGQWIASDPTFNVMYERNGSFLSYSDVYESLKRGQQFLITTNGYEVAANRGIENYYITHEDLFQYMYIHPRSTQVATTANLVRHKPDWWNGSVTLQDGSLEEVSWFGGIYSYLAQS